LDTGKGRYSEIDESKRDDLREAHCLREEEDLMMVFRSRVSVILRYLERGEEGEQYRWIRGTFMMDVLRAEGTNCSLVCLKNREMYRPYIYDRAMVAGLDHVLNFQIWIVF
jgi:hypothetical protein